MQKPYSVKKAYQIAGSKIINIGRPPKGKTPDKQELRKLYIEKSLSIREIAEFLGCTKDMVSRSLKEYGIETRTNKRRSGLRYIKLSILEKEVKRKGIRGYARELGVDESTLRYHLKSRRLSG